MKPGMEKAFMSMMHDLSEQSGYGELASTYFIPMGHSANGHFAWTFATVFPDRTIAAIPVKTIPLPDTLLFHNIPLCYVVGETTEWPQYRVPDPATKPGDRDFYWPVVRNAALHVRSQNKNNLIGVVTDPGGGHFDWSEHLSRFIALYIGKACRYRLPRGEGGPLRNINKESGWLTGSEGMDKDLYEPAPYRLFKGPAQEAYWFFDKQTAMEAAGFEGDRVKRKKQLPTFVQDGQLLPVAKQGFAALGFTPDSDGVSFHVKGGFLTAVPPELIGSGTPLGHAPGQPSFRIISGPAIQTGPADFRIAFDRGSQGGDVWIQEEQAGNDEYRYAVQPGKLSIPKQLSEGDSQRINFDPIPDVPVTTASMNLTATSTAGLPVRYFVESGPAIITGDILHLTAIPPRTRFPVKVIVTAYQWGRPIPPKVKSAPSVTRAFFIYR
jgi:hypothetical protein